MRQTLFYIPHWLFQGPLLVAWLIIGALVFAWLVRKNGWTSESFNFLPVYFVAAAILYFVAPNIEVLELNPADPQGPPIPAGLAVRGYGLFMLLGLAAGVGLSMLRGWRQGIHPDRILTLAFWMVICGIIGARMFYVIQKHEEFTGGSLAEVIGRVLNMTEGGLVVYGSLIGAAAGGWFYLWRAKLPALRLADIAAPGMVAGLALGRIGCLMNGCCYGGVCEVPSIAQAFPAGSPPFMEQLYQGELLGIEPVIHGKSTEQSSDAPSGDGWFLAGTIEKGSLAEQSGVAAGEWFRIYLPDGPMPPDKYFRAEQAGIDTGMMIGIEQPDSFIEIPVSKIPVWSVGVFPTQIMAAINAALLSALLWFYFPFRRYDGRVFALMLVLYAISRFTLEMIRRDESGQFGTDLTIAQWVSIVMLVVGAGLFFICRQRSV